MSPTAPERPLREPRQERARRTLKRILDVTEGLLEERSFEAITVAEIVRVADTSVGAFYTRFRNKDALLPALYERYDRWIREHAAELERGQPWDGLDLQDTVTWLVEELVGLFCGRRYLMRALTLHARLRPGKIDAETRARRERQMAFLGRALLEHRAEINHSDPERAVELAIFMAAALCREWLLFHDAPHAATTDADESEVAREVGRQMLGYLRGPAETPAPSAGGDRP